MMAGPPTVKLLAPSLTGLALGNRTCPWTLESESFEVFGMRKLGVASAAGP